MSSFSRMTHTLSWFMMCCTWLCCVVQDGPPTRRNQNVAKRLRTKALKATCKAAGRATKLAANAASPSQVSLLHWLAWTKPMPEQLGSVLDCLHRHSLHSSWVCEPLQLTSLSLPLPSVRATRYAHVCTSIHTSLLLLDSCPTYCDRCPVLRGELSMNSQTSCLYTLTLL